jgi:signal transduction histidine kinase
VVGATGSARRAMSLSRAQQYSRWVAGAAARVWFWAEELRRIVPVFALAVTIVAITTDPSSADGLALAADLLLAAAPVVAFAVWAYRPNVPLVALSAAALVPVVVAQRSGQLEPLMFQASLLALVVGRWAPSPTTAKALGLVAVASPVAVSLIQDPSEIAVAVWIIGILLPWVVGRAFARHEQVAAELAATRQELARQALLAERRQIARDVHDFVGHGLAAVMLQVTSARHVLRRDVDAAEEALRSAEEVGRRSMRELRRTVGLLRSDDEPGVAPPLPSVAEIPVLVEEARAGGLAVELHCQGDVLRLPPGVSVAAYRIAQEALANAARHAPRAHTLLGLELMDGAVQLVAETTGPIIAAPASERERPHYGLIGMHERAAALGGECAAGPTPSGWRVSCRLPVADEEGR